MKNKNYLLCFFLVAPCFLGAQKENEAELLNQEELEKAFAYANPVVKSYAYSYGYNYKNKKSSKNGVKITNKEEKKNFLRLVAPVCKVLLTRLQNPHTPIDFNVTSEIQGYHDSHFPHYETLSPPAERETLNFMIIHTPEVIDRLAVNMMILYDGKSASIETAEGREYRAFLINKKILPVARTERIAKNFFLLTLFYDGSRSIKTFPQNEVFKAVSEKYCSEKPLLELAGSDWLRGKYNSVHY